MASLKDLANKLKSFLQPQPLVSAQPWNNAGKGTPQNKSYGVSGGLVGQLRQKTLEMSKPIAQKYQQIARTPISQSPAPIRFAAGVMEGLEPVNRFGKAVFDVAPKQALLNVSSAISGQNTPRPILQFNQKLAENILKSRQDLGLEKPGLKTGAKVLADTARTGLLFTGAKYLPQALSSTALGTALGTTFRGISGEDVPTALGKSFTESLSAQGLGRFTSPVIEPITKKAVSLGGGKLINQLTGRTVQGGLNVIEDEIYSALQGFKPKTIDRLTSFGIGAILSPSANEQLFKKVPLTPVEKKTISQRFRDLRGRYSTEAGINPKSLDYMVEDPNSRQMVLRSKLDERIPGVMSDLEKLNRYLEQKTSGFGNVARSIRDEQGNIIPERVKGLTPEVKQLKYKTTLNPQDKNDFNQLKRIFNEEIANDIKNGKTTNWRGTSYEDLGRVNIVSETPKTVEQQIGSKIKDVKLKSNTFYHGTSGENARGIMTSGFKTGAELPETTFRGGGYGQMQNSISLAETPKEASIFSKLSKDGEIVETKLKDNAKVVSIDGVEDAIDVEDYIPYLREKRIDAVYIGGGEKELLVINPKSVTPIKSQLTDIYNQAKGLTPEVTTKAVEIPQLGKQSKTLPALTKLTSVEVPTKLQPESRIVQIKGRDIQQSQPFDNIIQDAKKQIGKAPEPKDQTFKESLDDLYTQWVDRYNPIVKASKTAKETLKIKGAELRPEYDPEYLVRRLTGAGGIADYRFRTELDPVIKQAENLGINKGDLDVYLANRRMAGFGQVGRDVYGADPKKSSQIVSALESKYGQNIRNIADQLYSYQNKGFQEMVDAGFISPKDAKIIQSQNPDYSPLYRVMDEVDDYLGLPTRKTMQGTQPVTKIKGSTRQIESPIESVIGNTFRQRAAIEKNRVAQSIVDLQGVTDLGFKKVSKSSPGTITVWRNGQKEYWNVGKDIAETAKGVNEEQMNVVLKVLQAPASLLRQGATGRNPEFMIPNIIRDQLDAGITSKYGYIPFVDYFSGLKSMLGNDEIYQKWQSSGAKIDLGELGGKKSISKLFDEKTAKKGLFSWLGEGLDFMGKYSEVPTRVGLFKKAYNKTGNELISALESRDATVDFARMGSKMKVANSIIPFLNVGVQGFDKLIRSIKGNPGKVALNMALYGATPAITTTLYNLQNYPQEYSEIPQYEKDDNFIIVKGRNPNGNVNYIKIPKGNILPVVSNPIENFLSFISGQDSQSIGKLSLSLFGDLLPVIEPGGSVKEVLTKTIGSNIPQAFKPAAETLLNKSFYKYDPNKEQSKEIVPSYLQKREPYQQFYEWTPKLYQKVGALVNASPLKVQNLAEGYLAGFAKIPANIVEIMSKVSRGEEISPNEKPLMRRFFGETYPSSAKPAEKVPTTPLMERITGKVSASENGVPTLSDFQKESLKFKFKSSGKESMKIADGVFFVKASNGDVNTIDISKEIPEPKYSGSESMDKKRRSAYKSALSKRGSDIVKLVDAGLLTEEQGQALMDEVEIKYDKTLKGKKPKKITIKPVTIKTPKTSSFKFKKPKTFKLPSLKIKNSRPKKSKSIRISKTPLKKIKAKKIKSLTVGTKLL